MNSFFSTIPNLSLDLLKLPILESLGIDLAVLRLDKTDTLVSGNKWFKLQYHVQEALAQKSQGIISVGGAHSNHLHAMAAIGQKLGLATVGLLRGEPVDTPTNLDLQRMGMTLHWLGYAEYRNRYKEDFWQKWQKLYPNFYPVPEGGGGILGAKGCCIIPKLIEERLARINWDYFDCIYVGVGTGSTLAGIVWGAESKYIVHGCLAVPERYGVDQQIKVLLDEIALVGLTHYQLHAAARKGFGQMDETLLSFIKEVEDTTGLLLDPVYTGKTLYYLQQQAMAGEIREGTKIVLIHTGGLQGRRVWLDN